MSVIFAEFTRNMTPTNKLCMLVLSIVLLEDTAGAPFSTVVVRREDVVPLEYIDYDPPSVLFGNVPASTLPLESLVQVPALSAATSPCLIPCIIPDTTSQGLIPSTSNAKLVTLKSIPATTTNKEATRGYQYAYSVYDDHTGDKKSQSEQSDGSVVRGQYSFIQPDGFLREVVYTADDLKGFNAVVKHISPKPDQLKETNVNIGNPQPAPCSKPQHEKFTEYHEKSLGAIPEVEYLEKPSIAFKSMKKNDDAFGLEDNKKKLIKNSEEKPKKPKPHQNEPMKPVLSFQNNFPGLKNVITFNDIIKCLNSKLLNANSAISPITFILIPSLEGLC